MDLREHLRSRAPLLLDGAMGTELDRRSSPDRCLSNITNPDAVKRVHADYVAAGSRAIITNTLTMNRVFVEVHGLGIDVRRVNREGAQLARSAAGRLSYVLGNLSSTGQMIEPYGDLALADVEAAFEEQARVLAEGGVDGFIVETMFDLREALAALKACRHASELPVIVCIAFDTVRDGGRTIMGNTARDCAAALAAEGADAVGANCGRIDPEQMAAVVATMRASCDLPVAAEPNAGLPRLVDGKTLFDMDARTFASGLDRCVAAGARLVGGCCGTTPDHIRAVAELLGS